MMNSMRSVMTETMPTTMDAVLSARENVAMESVQEMKSVMTET
jgi:hypothetical protein